MKKIYIDFDGTLYNTDSFYKDFLDINLKYGISKEEIELIKNNIFKNSLFNIDVLSDYIIKKYNLRNNYKEEVNKLFNLKYVFDDIIYCLEKLKDKYELIILTYGDYNYQNKKIEGSNLKKYFKDIIITNNKSNVSNIDYKNSIFIDNNPNEIKKFIDVNAFKVIRIRRDIDKYSVIDIENDVNEYKSFKEILKKEFNIK